MEISAKPPASTDTVVLSIEQLYPFPARALIQELSRYPNATDIVWCQEEPKNMGAWSFIDPNMEWVLDHVGQAGVAGALCRPPGFGLHRNRFLRASMRKNKKNLSSSHWVEAWR